MSLDAIDDLDTAREFALQVCYAFGRPDVERRLPELLDRLTIQHGRLTGLSFNLAATGRPSIEVHLRPVSQFEAS